VPFANAFVSDKYTSPSSHTTAADPVHAPPPGALDPAAAGEGLGGCTGGGAGGSGGAEAGISVPSGPKMMSDEVVGVVVGGGAGGGL
jgi:hypothetical protein